MGSNFFISIFLSLFLLSLFSAPQLLESLLAPIQCSTAKAFGRLASVDPGSLIQIGIRWHGIWPNWHHLLPAPSLPACWLWCWLAQWQRKKSMKRGKKNREGGI